MIPFFTQKDFIAFGRTADGPFCYQMVHVVTNARVNKGKTIVPMLHYMQITVSSSYTHPDLPGVTFQTEPRMSIDTVRVVKMPVPKYRRLMCLYDDRPLKDQPNYG